MTEPRTPNPWRTTLIVIGGGALVIGGALAIIGVGMQDDFDPDGSNTETLLALDLWSNFLFMAATVALVGWATVGGVAWELRHRPGVD